MKNYLLKILYWAPLSFIVLLLFAFPLIFSFFIHTYNVFELLKAAILWPAVLILLLLSLIKIWVFKINIRNYLSNNFFIILFLIIIFLLINTFFVASNYELALFGDYNRRQGLFTQLSYVLFFSLVVFNLLTISNFKKNINYLLLSISFSGFLVALYGFFQYIGFDLFVWQETVVASRVISSLGQPNFLASFLLLSLGVTFACLFKFKIFYLKLFCLINIFFQLLAIYLSSSRSAFIALILVFILALFIFIKKRKSKLIFSLSAIISSIVFIILLINFLPSSRFSQAFNLEEGSSLARKEFYTAALEIIKDKPVLGYGLEQAANSFVRYYKPSWALFSKVNDYPDRAHNVVLDMIINFGIVGFLLFSFIFLYLIYLLLFKNNEKQKYLYFIHLGILAYLISLMFSFPSLATSFYFWTLLAILFSFYLYKLKREAVYNFKFKKTIFIFLVTLNIFLIILSLNNSLRTIKADEKFLSCYNNLDNFHYCWQALDLVNDPSQRDYYQVTIINYYIDRHNLFSEDFKIIFDNYLLMLYPQIKENNYELVFTKAKLSCYLNKEDYKSLYEDLINYSPNRPAVYYSQANCYSYLGENEKAIDSYNLALALLPDIYDLRINQEHQASLKMYSHLLFYGLGQSYALMEDYKKAISYYNKAYYHKPEDVNIFKNIGQANYLLGNYQEAIDNYLFAWQKDKNNNYWPLMISQIYNELGNEEKAQLYFKKINN